MTPWIILLLLVLCFAETLAHRTHLPAALLLLLAGVAAGNLPAGTAWSPPDFSLTQETIFFIFLPLLIFTSARRFHPNLILKLVPESLLMAMVGTLLAVTAFAWPVMNWLGLSFPAAFLLGTALAATDPLALTAVLHPLRPPPRLLQLIESESLLNDGITIWLFTLLSNSALGRSEAIGPNSILTFFTLILGGVLVGLAVAGLALLLLKLWCGRHNRLVPVLIPLAAVYGGFWVSEHLLHVSGVLAVFACTLLLTARSPKTGSCAEITSGKDSFYEPFWDLLETVMSGVLFFCLGAVIANHAWNLTVFITLGVLLLVELARAVSVGGSFLLLFPTRHHLPAAWTPLLQSAGIKGAVTVALVLSLPENLPERQFIVCTVFAAVLFTMGIHPPVARLLARRLA
ncbi:MAG: cation:proton antiporter [Kiritimatiellia bacterium]